MSIRAIAQEVYKCQARVHDLEDQLRRALPQEKGVTQEKLRQARAELKMVKVMLENRKSTDSTRKSRFSF